MSNNLPTYLTISTDIDRDLSDAIESIVPDKIAVLVDENTRHHCFPLVSLKSNLIIEIKSGEREKTLSTCKNIWSQLTSNGFTRNSLLVNLGGGVIGDMGGFAAVTFKRGMAFINVPTTLLSQVDASIGGKLGVDFEGLKNHIGVFQEPNKVIVYPKFLDTLPERELKSGFAEVIKHSLIRSESQWDYLKTKTFQDLNWEEIIPRSIAIKSEVVNEDPREIGVRKILNYGHTIGHAIESHFLDSSSPLLHGEAIAWGMILENKIGVEVSKLDQEVSKEIENYILSIYDLPVKVPDYQSLKNHLLQDKKNDAQGIRFSLLTQVNSCTYDVLVEERVLKEILK